MAITNAGTCNRIVVVNEVTGILFQSNNKPARCSDNNLKLTI